MLKPKAKRSPLACERCRQMRRRCAPPHPCHSCQTADVPCEVRTKARPKRQPSNVQVTTIAVLPLSPPQINDSNEIADKGPGSTGTTSDNTSAHTFVKRTSVTSTTSGSDDTFDVLKSLAQDVLLQKHGYVLECTLVEPSSFMSSIASDHEGRRSVLHPASQGVQCPPLFSPNDTANLLRAFCNIMGWQGAKLVDVESMIAIADSMSEQLSQLTLDGVQAFMTVQQLPLDSLALLSGALGLGAIAIGEVSRGRLYSDLSNESIKFFVGKPTLDLCLAYFLQHVFALRAGGTLNYARGFVVQAIQHAHDLQIQHNTHGVRGLQIYLLIYMADQYCALTHNSKPIISASTLPDETFKPLSDTEPQLRTLIALVTMNGYIIEHSTTTSDNERLRLESMIGKVYSQQIDPVPGGPCEGLRSTYEPLARVHMLCCRMKLRAPSLSDQDSWVASICVCVQSAEGVLSTYFQLYHCLLSGSEKQSQPPAPRWGNSVTYALSPTWRQVRRIMMSAFVIIIAYWRGELTHGEALRYFAMARLLLEYTRGRWGDKLDEALKTLHDISRLGNFNLDEQASKLLPGIETTLSRSIHNVQDTSTRQADATPQAPVENAQEQASSTSWQTTTNSFYTENLFASDAMLGIFDSVPPGVSEANTFFDMWDNIELHVPGASWSKGS